HSAFRRNREPAQQSPSRLGTHAIAWRHTSPGLECHTHRTHCHDRTDRAFHPSASTQRSTVHAIRAHGGPYHQETRYPGSYKSSLTITAPAIEPSALLMA